VAPEGRSPSSAWPASSPALPALRPRRPWTAIAAALVAAAGMAGMTVGLIRGPSRTEQLPVSAVAPVRSVVLDRFEPPPQRSPSLAVTPPAPPRPILSAQPSPVVLPPRADRPAHRRSRFVARPRRHRGEHAVAARGGPSSDPGGDLAPPVRPESHRQLDEKDPYLP
jgi:hypothetical protein